MVEAVSREGSLRVLGWNLGHKAREVANPPISTRLLSGSRHRS